MDPSAFLHRTAELADTGRPFVVATLVDATGSTPSDAGAQALVTAEGLEAGTVGGGRVEARVIDEAHAMLAGGADSRFFDWSLKADLGMTCGGRVRLHLRAYNASAWRVVIFGAGHVTQALCRLLVTVPCRVTCIDPREEWLAKLPDGVERLCADDPPEEVSRLPDDAFVLCMTRGHKSDMPVLARIFGTSRVFPYLGVIGSKAKAAVLRKELIEAGVADDVIRFHCPVGLPFGSNHPGEIAVSIAAQLLEARDRVKSE